MGWSGVMTMPGGDYFRERVGRLVLWERLLVPPITKPLISLSISSFLSLALLLTDLLVFNVLSALFNSSTFNVVLSSGVPSGGVPGGVPRGVSRG